MSVFRQIPRAELGTRYTHRGWMWFCPIYIGQLDTDCPTIAERNGVPAWVLDLALGLERAIDIVGIVLDRDYEPSFMFRVTGAIATP